LGKKFPIFLKELTLLKRINNVDSTGDKHHENKKPKKSPSILWRGYAV
jgi:hypothetical protein